MRRGKTRTLGVMTKDRADLLVWIGGLLLFLVLLYLWTGFLQWARCVDLGGVMENGTCAGAREPMPTFWQASWGFQLLALIPPGIVSGIVIAAGSWLVAHGGPDDA